MSNPEQARRTSIEVFFGGVDITGSLKRYLLSLTYTDNEEDETDDLQIKLQDTSGIWLTKWLNSAIQAAAEGESSKSSEDEAKSTPYKVVASTGATVHSRAGSKYHVYGTLAYGTVINVASLSGGWANFTYSGKNAYVNASCLQAINGGTSSSSGWNIGDEVVATGNPQYSSYGVGRPGALVTNYKGTVTHLNLKSGIPYPICVGSLGWFSESQVQKSSQTGQIAVEGTASKGLRIQAVIGRENWNGDGKDKVLNCGQFELDSVVASGPPATITIKGTSLPYSAAVRQTEKSKSWENYMLSGIANEIARNGGMTCMFLSNTDPSYERVEQYRTSDIVFLQKLCQDAGCSLKVSNNIIVIFDQAQYESKSAVKTIRRGDGYTKYKLSTGENNYYASCRVSYINSNGETITATAYVDKYNEKKKDNQCLEIRQKVSNTAEAMNLARKMLRLHNKYEFSVTFTYPGDPSLVAGCTVMLSGWGAWDGKYIIKQAKHSVSHSGYTTQITLRRSLGQEAQSDNSEATTASDTYFSVGDKVMCNPGVNTFYNGVHMASWVPSAVLYVRQVEQNGSILLVSIEPTKKVYTGRVKVSDVHKV